jgi:hypothetical protein
MRFEGLLRKEYSGPRPDIHSQMGQTSPAGKFVPFFFYHVLRGPSSKQSVFLLSLWVRTRTNTSDDQLWSGV